MSSAALADRVAASWQFGRDRSCAPARSSSTKPQQLQLARSPRAANLNQAALHNVRTSPSCRGIETYNRFAVGVLPTDDYAWDPGIALRATGC